ncbi:MAG: carbohydrate ABC transporter permease [bacterium]
MNRSGGKILFYALLCAASLFFVMPFVWMVSSSLKTTEQIFVFPPKWIPNPVKWENYRDAVTFIPFLRYLWNTVLICIGNSLGNLFSASLVAYSFSRIRWRGRDIVFYLMLGTMLLPPQITMIPVFVIFRTFRVIDTYIPLILPAFFGTPFFIFLLRQFFRGIPESFSEAARMDGCSEFGIYWKIILPLSIPALTTVVLFTIIWSWVDFLNPLIYLQSPEKFTLSLGLQQFQSSHALEWGMLMAASTLMVLPMILLFFFAQKAFNRGIMAGGLRY